MTDSDSGQQDVAADRSGRLIARRLAVGFGLVAAVSLVMCALLLSLIGEVSGLVRQMRQDEETIRESFGLATAVREEYMHQAHWLIGRKPAHRHHGEDWLAHVEQRIEKLRPLLPPAEAEHLAIIRSDVIELHSLFEETIAPAALRGDAASVGRAHDRAQAVAQRAAERADELASAMEQRMAARHAEARRATRIGLLAGALGALLVVGLSFSYTQRLRRALLRPLRRLSAAARRFGAGDFHSRVGAVGEGELRELAEAFDHMAGEIELRERQLVKSERMAAIGQLAAGVAHEINNPIGIIRGYLRTMERDVAAAPLLEELRILDDEAAACQHIAEDLVAYARSADIHRGRVPMEKLLDESTRRFGESAAGQGVKLRVEAEAAEMCIDAGRIRQVVLNLLLNAAQIAGKHGPIEVNGRRQPRDGYEISVADRGPGIAAEDRARIFEPFFTKRAGGSGLGLSVCQGIVAAHGGEIAVEERPDGGTLFRVTLAPEADTARAGARESTRTGQPPAGEHGRPNGAAGASATGDAEPDRGEGECT